MASTTVPGGHRRRNSGSGHCHRRDPVGSLCHPFGSRARGDHRECSDVDLAVILGGAALDPKLRRDGVEPAIESVRTTANGQFLRIDVIVWTEEEYRLKKRSINHVAGRAWREGRILYGTHEDRPEKK